MRRAHFDSYRSTFPDSGSSLFFKRFATACPVLRRSTDSDIERIDIFLAILGFPNHICEVFPLFDGVFSVVPVVQFAEMEQLEGIVVEGQVRLFEKIPNLHTPAQRYLVRNNLPWK